MKRVPIVSHTGMAKHYGRPFKGEKTDLLLVTEQRLMPNVASSEFSVYQYEAALNKYLNAKPQARIDSKQSLSNPEDQY